MSRKWSDEQRRQQAERIRQWQPWRNSTGPRTRAGKRKAAKNRVRKPNPRAKLWALLIRELNRTGGPRTAEGKARALMNLKQYRARKTGKPYKIVVACMMEKEAGLQ